MIATDRKLHWEHLYSTTAETAVGWYQVEPLLSLELIKEASPAQNGRIIDVGGGASVLVDRLLELSFKEVAVLDICRTALGKARARLRERADRVRWIVADLTKPQELGTFDVWHDRAVFHFLTDENDRKNYIDLARQTVSSGGHLIIATFADDGPKQCSNLDVCRYNARSLSSALGEGFSLLKEARETHITPRGSAQAFFFGVFKRL